MKKLFFLGLTLLLFSCKPSNNTQFTSKALNSPLYNIQGNKLLFKNILDQYKGKTVLIKVWAGWCGDCIKGLPDLIEIQHQYPNTAYLFVSLDKNKQQWKKSIKRFSIKGNHYYAEGGWKSIFANNINLNWIPRYILIDKDGKVINYNATKIKNSNLLNALQTHN